MSDLRENLTNLDAAVASAAESIENCVETARALAALLQGRLAEIPDTDDRGSHAQALGSALLSASDHLDAARANMDTATRESRHLFGTPPTDDTDKPAAEPTSTSGGTQLRLRASGGGQQNVITAHQYLDIYSALGVNLAKLGCIMLDLDPIKVSDVIEPAHLYYARDPKKYPHMKGVVSESVPHATLLLGLMEPGPKIKEQVDTLLEGWSADSVVIDHVDYFDDPKPGEPQYCLIAYLDTSCGLSEANARLRLLPHIDPQPPNYRPHITLAYIIHDPAVRDNYIKILNERLAGARVKARGINYGW